MDFFIGLAIVVGVIVLLLLEINPHTYHCQKPGCDFECYDQVEAAGHDAFENRHKTV